MGITDYTIWSPQIETMNWVFMLDEIHKTRPDFFFELSTWDGDQPGAGNDKRKFYAKLGEPFSPARYEGMVQYGMWLMRPRVVRDFRSHTESVEYAGPYFRPILDAVDRVWNEPTLQKFWRQGNAGRESRGKHPYQADIPPEYKKVDRWFLLDTNLTPKELVPTEFDNAKPPPRQLEIPVFALAYVLGEKPNREWLVYAHAPRAARTNVAITLPDYGVFHADVTQSGTFIHAKEGPKGKWVGTIVAGGPASFRLRGPTFVEVGEPATFGVSDAYVIGGGGVSPFRFFFDIDGTSKNTTANDTVTHRFAKKGQYFVSVTETDSFNPVARKRVPIFVGMKPEKDVVCRLLMHGAMIKA